MWFTWPLSCLSFGQKPKTAPEARHSHSVDDATQLQEHSIETPEPLPVSKKAVPAEHGHDASQEVLEDNTGNSTSPCSHPIVFTASKAPHLPATPAMKGALSDVTEGVVGKTEEPITPCFIAPRQDMMARRPASLNVEGNTFLDIRSPTIAVSRTPLPLTPITGSSVGSPTLAILRTPMPFGSPVPYPAPDTDPTKAPDQAPVPHHARACASGDAPDPPAQFAQLPYTMPYELRHAEPGRTRESAGAQPPLTPGLSTALLPRRPSPLQSDSNSNTAAGLATPSPSLTQRFLTAASSAGSTPHIVGVRNPATAYKEHAAVKLRHTPFAERVNKEMEQEIQASRRLSHHRRGPSAVRS